MDHHHAMQSTAATISLLIPLSMGFMSSVTHCIGMCAPLQYLVLGRTHSMLDWLKYHLGRTFAYILLGSVTGALGMVVHARQMPVLMMSAKIILIATLLMTAIFFALGKESRWEKWLSRLIPTKWIYNQISDQSKPKSLVGFWTGFLPCPTTYATLLWALSSGKVWVGAVGMALFGVATFPTFYGLAFIGKKLKPFSRDIYRFTTAAVFGFLALWHIYHGFFSGPQMCH